MAEIGDRIGPFEIIELLEHGVVSNVYRGLRADGSSRPPREVVLRIATSGPEGPEPRGLQAVRAEYDALRALQDERIPEAVALYTGHGASARMWVQGATLRDTLTLVAAGRVDLDAATSMDILVELAYALRHAHAIVRKHGRIVHGSLAPEVVMLTAEGNVKLLGIGDPEPVHIRPLAPEQSRGVQDSRTDQWLLGALGIELLRHAPEVLQETRGAAIDVTYGLLQARWPEAARVLARLLAENPANRYETEEKLIKELLALARHMGGVSRRAEVGARTIQLAPALGGADRSLPPIREPQPQEGAGRASTGPVSLPPGIRAGSAQPPLPEPEPLSEPTDTEEVVAYTEETPLPFPVRPAPAARVSSRAVQALQPEFAPELDEPEDDQPEEDTLPQGGQPPDDEMVRTQPAPSFVEAAVPDRWVVGAVLFFLAVAALAVVWRLTGS